MEDNNAELSYFNEFIDLIFIYLVRFVLLVAMMIIPVIIFLFISMSLSEHPQMITGEIRENLLKNDIMKVVMIITGVLSYLLTPVLFERVKGRTLKEYKEGRNVASTKPQTDILVGIITGLLFSGIILLGTLFIGERFDYHGFNKHSISTSLLLIMVVVYIYCEDWFYRRYFAYRDVNKNRLWHFAVSNIPFILITSMQISFHLLALINICLLSFIIYQFYELTGNIYMGVAFRSIYVIFSCLFFNAETLLFSSKGIGNYYDSVISGRVTGMLNHHNVSIGFAVIVVLLQYFYLRKHKEVTRDLNVT